MEMPPGSSQQNLCLNQCLKHPTLPACVLKHGTSGPHTLRAGRELSPKGRPPWEAPRSCGQDPYTSELREDH